MLLFKLAAMQRGTDFQKLGLPSTYPRLHPTSRPAGRVKRTLMEDTAPLDGSEGFVDSVLPALAALQDVRSAGDLAKVRQLPDLHAS